ncbi:hypothetical protein TELCIR_24733 [Teladorsagia circumcincta]|uniref:Ankyrin repeat protein n=1 Tax=Teladorsagia circumcincta TaxID=45464 RepID=A0A2G9T7G2_TELCI|nr:hypothetical protein TELCIR_24733 [Teladorsagia circumcincta]
MTDPKQRKERMFMIYMHIQWTERAVMSPQSKIEGIHRAIKEGDLEKVKSLMASKKLAIGEK